MKALYYLYLLYERCLCPYQVIQVVGIWGNNTVV